MLRKIPNTSHFFLYIFILTANISEQAYAMLPDASDIYEKAINTNPLVKKNHEDGLKRRQEEERQLTKILDSISENHTKDSGKLCKSVIDALKQDKFVFEAVDVELKREDPGSENFLKEQ